MKGMWGAIASAALLAGCNNINVKQAVPQQGFGLLCIVHNPAVKVDDFVDVLQEGFSRHGLQSVVITSQAGPECGSTVTYTARRSWDFSAYLALAKVDVWRGGQRLAGLYYEHNNGLSLVKWQGTAAKLNPLIDEMLAQVEPDVVPASESVPSATTSPQPANSGTQQESCKSCASIGRNL